MDKVCIDCQSKFAAPGRNICYSCKQARYKRANPVKYAYRKLRANASRRGKRFELTLDEFREFCQKTKYLVGKGRSKESYHIDRINPSRGYTKDNIQVLTNSENIKKHLSYMYDPYKKKMEFWVRTEKKGDIQDDDCPF